MAGTAKYGIIWLASYPKSGNTWVRTFLTNYQRDSNQPADINDLDGGPIASARRVFDDAVGIEASDLTPEEIDRYRPAVYKQIAQDLDAPLFLKVHDAYTMNEDGMALFPESATQLVLYIIRNPLDVAVSFAHHSTVPTAEMIDRMCNPENAFCARQNRLHNQLRQKLLTWSGHVISWVDAPGLQVTVVRYEDMVRNTVPTFKSIVMTAGLALNPDKLAQALDYSSFDRLQAMERHKGFRERAPKREHSSGRGKWVIGETH